MKLNLRNKRVAVYNRKSREIDGLGIDTLEKHREELKGLLKTYEVSEKVTDWYEEVVGSTVTNERIEFEKLTKNIKDYSYIFCVHLDRLGRNEEDLVHVKRLCYAYDIQIVTPSRVYDMDSENDDMIYSFDSFIATMEGKRIKKRLRDGKKRSAREGNYMRGTVPYGYTFNTDTKRLEVEPEEAKVVKMVFELCVQGLGVKLIRDRLQASKIKNRTGGEFSTRGLSKMLSNRVYIGDSVVIYHFIVTRNKEILANYRNKYIELSRQNVISFLHINRGEFFLCSSYGNL